MYPEPQDAAMLSPSTACDHAMEALYSACLATTGEVDAYIFVRPFHNRFQIAITMGRRTTVSCRDAAVCAVLASKQAHTSWAAKHNV